MLSAYQGRRSPCVVRQCLAVEGGPADGPNVMSESCGDQTGPVLQRPGQPFGIHAALLVKPAWQALQICLVVGDVGRGFRGLIV